MREEYGEIEREKLERLVSILKEVRVVREV